MHKDRADSRLSPAQDDTISFSREEVELMREWVQYAICALQDEAAYVGRADSLSSDDSSAKEFMECAIDDLQMVDALIESRVMAGEQGGTH